MKRAPTIRMIKENTSCTEVSVSKNILTFRDSYFYRMGKTAESFKSSIVAELQRLEVRFNVIGCGDNWREFKGGASVRASSHFWVKVEIFCN